MVHCRIHSVLFYLRASVAVTADKQRLHYARHSPNLQLGQRLEIWPGIPLVPKAAFSDAQVRTGKNILKLRQRQTGVGRRDD